MPRQPLRRRRPLPLNNATSEEGTNCPLQPGRLAAPRDQSEQRRVDVHHVSSHLGEATTYVRLATVVYEDGGVSSRKTLTSLIKSGSTAEITCSSEGSEPSNFQLSNVGWGMAPCATAATVMKDGARTSDQTHAWDITKTGA